MFSVEDVTKVLMEEFKPSEDSDVEKELEQFLFERFGKSEEIYSILQIIVKSGAEYKMSVFDDLPSDIRVRLEESPFELDERAILDFYSQFGEIWTIRKISQMEQVAKRILENETCQA